MAESILTTARAIADELIAAGAQAVILLGSHVRGDFHPHSDIDLLALGEGPTNRLERRGSYLIAVSWQTAAACREIFKQPLAAGGAIPGWRSAALLRDPQGVAAAIQQEAQRWTWEDIAGQADALVAEEITGWAEEVHKLVGALAGGRWMMAAVQRNVLALKMAGIMAARHRVLYDTENRLWDLIAARLGPGWAAAQARAFGLGGEPFAVTCHAALELYALTAAEALPLLDERQRAVVTHACRIAGYPLP